MRVMMTREADETPGGERRKDCIAGGKIASQPTCLVPVETFGAFIIRIKWHVRKENRKSICCRLVLRNAEASGGPLGALRGPLRGAYSLR